MKRVIPIVGIYQIRNRQTGEVYIGGSVHVHERIRGHLGLLRSGHHENKRLQRAWTTFGPSAFSFSMLEILAPDSDIITAERRWFDLIQARVPGVYNMAQIRPGVRESRRRAAIAEALDVPLKQLLVWC